MPVLLVVAVEELVAHVDGNKRLVFVEPPSPGTLLFTSSSFFFLLDVNSNYWRDQLL